MQRATMDDDFAVAALNACSQRRDAGKRRLAIRAGRIVVDRGDPLRDASSIP